MKMTGPIPTYALFGQSAGLVEPRFCHVERISDRWPLHGGQVEQHSHPHLHQMTLWITGAGTYVADDMTAAIGAGTFCWITAGVVHGFRVESGSDAIVLSMSEDFAREQLAELIGVRNIYSDSDRLIQRLSPEVFTWLSSLFHRMEAEYTAATASQTLAVGALARLALIEAQRAAQAVSASNISPDVEAAILQRFLALVDQELNRRPNVEKLAQDIGTTPYLLNRICRTALNMRASEVVRARHMQEAKRLLLFTALSVHNIGALVGYNDPAHFTRAFRAVTGFTPKDWRETRMAAQA